MYLYESLQGGMAYEYTKVQGDETATAYSNDNRFCQVANGDAKMAHVLQKLQKYAALDLYDASGMA